MTWQQLTERDCREWKLLAISPQDRHTWRSGVRSAIHAASQLPGRGPTDGSGMNATAVLMSRAEKAEPDTVFFCICSNAFVILISFTLILPYM